jgi:DNA-binding transcriptional LysR family regulator
MNLYHLRYFVTLAHMEHYTRAADLLAITQPSLSHAISSLESELGVKLFKKNGRNVTLTKYGKSFLTDAEDILQKLDASVGSLQLAGKGEGHIDIAFLRTLGSDFVPRILRRFLDENQGKQIDFALHCDKVITNEILKGIKEQKYDIGVEPMPYSGIPDVKKGWAVVKAADCDNAKLILDTWHCHVHPDHPVLHHRS